MQFTTLLALLVTGFVAVQGIVLEERQPGTSSSSNSVLEPRIGCDPVCRSPYRCCAPNHVCKLQSKPC